MPSDGTSAGTALVRDINPGPGGSAFADGPRMADVNGTLFFAANDGVHGTELWKSDGTAAGTVMVKDINPGSGSSLFTNSWNYLTNVNGTLFFAASDGTHGNELWKSDGTDAGTVMVSDINKGSANSYPRQLTNVNGTLFFAADDGKNGSELWKSDGTAAGTVMVKDINPGSSTVYTTYCKLGHPFIVHCHTNKYQVPNSSVGRLGSSSSFTNVNGTLFFTADDGTHGPELWKSDGTDAGTVLVKDINPGSLGSSPSYLTNVNGTLFFAASDGTHGNELWKSDGTAAGTVMVSDINKGSANSYLRQLTNVNGTLFFTADDGIHGRQVWKSDGTAAGTVMVSDINPPPLFLTNVNGTLFFEDQGGLWKSDGTAAGTVLVSGVVSPYKLTNVSGTLYFAGYEATHGKELWKSDGTSAGTVLVADINPGSASSNPANLTVSGGHLFFTADDGVHGVELWDPPISPAPRDQAIPAVEGIRSSSETLPLHALADKGDAAAGVLTSVGMPWSGPWQDGTRSIADDPARWAFARAAENPPTNILDQIFAEHGSQPTKSESALALDGLGDPDLLEDLALSWQLA